MFQHSAPETNLVQQNDFSCDRNVFVAVEMNLSLMAFERQFLAEQFTDLGRRTGSPSLASENPSEATNAL